VVSVAAVVRVMVPTRGDGGIFDRISSRLDIAAPIRPRGSFILLHLQRWI
jgi:hypothetical protein